MEPMIRELANGSFIVSLPGSELIGPPCHTQEEAEQQVKDYMASGGAEVPSTNPGVHAPGNVPDGYHIEVKAGWFKLIGPDGEQVGKSRRSAPEAAAELNA